MNLYQMTTEAERLFEQLNQSPEDAHDEILARLSELAGGINQKMADCCAYYKNLQAEIEALTTESARLMNKARAVEKRKDRLEAYISSCLPHAEKWSNGVHSVSWWKSTYLDDSQALEIPIEYMRERVTHSLDKIRLRKDIESGKVIPGVEIKERFNLQIK